MDPAHRPGRPRAERRFGVTDRPVSDADLVTAARAGDRDAFAVLVRRHRPMVVAVCRRMLDDATLAEDAAQEAILAALTGLRRLRRPERFGAWLAGIGANMCRRWLRHSAKAAWSWEALHGGGWVPPVAAAPVDPAEISEARDLAARVRGAVAGLSAGQRQAVVGYYVLGLSQREVAALLGTSTAAVKTRLHKARSALRTQLLALWEEETMTATDPAVPVRIKDVYRLGSDGPRDHYVVLLEETGGDRRLPIWVGEAEGTALAFTLENAELPRPMTYQFAASLLEAAGARLRETRITRLEDVTYYATVTVDGPGGRTRLDARPSDALNVAAILGAPVTVDPAVFDAAASREGSDPGSAPDEVTRAARGAAADIVAERTAAWQAQREAFRTRLKPQP